MSPVILFGVGAGVGLVLTVRGVRPAPVSLTSALDRIDRLGRSVEQRRAEATPDRRLGSARRLSGALSGRLGRRVEADLAVMDQSAELLALEKLTTALSLGGIVVALAVVLSLSHAALPGGFTAFLVVAAVAVGFVIPDLTLHVRAGARRTSFRHALSSYLDLVNVLLAGGAGVETSMEAAAQAGDGWSFVQLRNALVRARALRQSPWQCFTELGERLDVEELREIAASVQLAGEQGARVKRSLAAKAAALRSHHMARIEADAQSATERMGIPTVLMFVGFIALLGYPAMQQIVTAL